MDSCVLEPGSEVDFLVRYKGITADRARQLLGQVTAAAAGEGLLYDFDAIRHTSTLKAHQLIHYAKARGSSGPTSPRAHTGRDDVLAGLAAEIGLDRDDVLRSLAPEEHHDRGVSLGITGVPFFVIDGPQRHLRSSTVGCFRPCPERERPADVSTPAEN